MHKKRWDDVVGAFAVCQRAGKKCVRFLPRVICKSVQKRWLLYKTEASDGWKNHRWGRGWHASSCSQLEKDYVSLMLGFLCFSCWFLLLWWAVSVLFLDQRAERCREDEWQPLTSNILFPSPVTYEHMSSMYLLTCRSVLQWITYWENQLAIKHFLPQLVLRVLV